MNLNSPFATPEQRHVQFMNSPVALAHKAIRDEIVSELHLDFERRENGVHAVCTLCRRSIAPLTDIHSNHEVGYVYTLENLATLFMAHFMQRHYDQEGRRG
jgi:hypothetical protein